MTEPKARILLYDIENMGILGWTFGPTYEANILHIEHYPHLLTVAWKWLGEPRTHVLGLDDFKSYKTNIHNDYELVRHVHGLFEEADMVIAHNGDQFDQKMMNTRFMYHRMRPPAPYKQLDTKKLAKRYGRFTSNSLDNLGDFMELGRKEKHGDFEALWLAADRGDPKALKEMKKYNKKDVKLLESWYLELRPWVSGHPSVALLEDSEQGCPKCGKGPLKEHKKRKIANSTWKMQYQCENCGGYSTARVAERTEKPAYVN